MTCRLEPVIPAIVRFQFYLNNFDADCKMSGWHTMHFRIPNLDDETIKIKGCERYVYQVRRVYLM